MANINNQSYNEQVKKKDESSVNGYIREVEKNSFKKTSFYKTIPMVINYLCNQYYHEPKDRFHPDSHGKNLKVTDEKVTLIDKSQKGASAFLSNVVSTGVHTWKFKQLGKKACFIGIINDIVDINNEYVLNWHFNCCWPKKTFGLFLLRGQLRGGKIWHQWGKTYCPMDRRKGDITELCLDLNKGELKFIVNSVDYGKAFDIPLGYYRVGVCLAFDDIGFELLQYNNK